MEKITIIVLKKNDDDQDGKYIIFVGWLNESINSYQHFK